MGEKGDIHLFHEILCIVVHLHRNKFVGQGCCFGQTSLMDFTKRHREHTEHEQDHECECLLDDEAHRKWEELAEAKSGGCGVAAADFYPRGKGASLAQMQRLRDVGGMLPPKMHSNFDRTKWAGVDIYNSPGMPPLDVFDSLFSMRAKTVADDDLDWFWACMRSFWEMAAPGTMADALRPDEHMTERESDCNIGMLFLALTPAFAMYWTIVQLSLHPDYLQRARENQAFLICCIRESMRMYPPVPITFERDVKRDIVLPSGATIRKGAHVMNCPLFVHGGGADRALKGSAAQFQPERWSEEAAREQGVRYLLQHDFEIGYFPFGLGQHECAGRVYAVQEVLDVVEEFIDSFDVNWSAEAEEFFALEVPLQFSEFGSAYARPSQDVYCNLAHRRSCTGPIHHPCGKADCTD
jgi:Cytochrome P450